MEYDFREIEKKWQDTWNKNNAYKVSNNTDKSKCYVLDMFPYPSGTGLHVGHPLGYDSFGLPAEQYALETGQHPAVTTENNIQTFRRQLDKIGFCYDWSRE